MAQLDLEIAELAAGKIGGPSVAPVDLRIEELKLRKQRRTVENLRSRLEESRIRARHDGTVTRILVELSDMVREYQPVVEVADMSELELQMEASADQFRDFYIGQEVLFEAGEDEWSTARVVRLTHENPRDDVSIRRERRLVHLTPVDSGIELRPNARHTVRVIIEQSKDTLTIPRSALREFNGRTYVRVLEGEARREVDVRVGLEDETRVEILAGLEEGDLVIGR
jgi:macrolide-specific efflux system membrane fusion protein